MNNYTVATYLNRHEEYLNQLISNQHFPSQRLKDAMYYALFPGGKRFRPLLVYLAGELLSTNLNCLDNIAAAIELTHCYSLVHDDLPAMDNDDLRRGRPSCHRAFDEGTAILVGDALQIFAVDILFEHLPPFLESNQIIKVAHALSKASGPSGMISGQCLDLYELNNRQVDEKTLRKIHELKTGQLMIACMNMVIAASNHSITDANQSLINYAQHLGLAFQMQDDYLDCYAHPDVLGKGHASDISNQKSTFATSYPKQELKNLIDAHFESAQQSLICFGERASKLQQLAAELQQRHTTT